MRLINRCLIHLFYASLTACPRRLNQADLVLIFAVRPGGNARQGGILMRYLNNYSYCKRAFETICAAFPRVIGAKIDVLGSMKAFLFFLLRYVIILL